jgi:proline iminopeptidase
VLEEELELAVDGGVLRGHRAGSGAPALLLHGGAAVPGYLRECAAMLDRLFSTIRYTQRGTPPSDVGPPYSIEAHVADAVAVLDAFELDQAWAIGDSWGGHLALHIAVAYPKRLLGVLLIDPLGADPAILADQDANLRRGLTQEQRARVDEVEAQRRIGEATEAELVERFAILWPQFFTAREPAIPAPARVGVESSIGTNRSIAEHFRRESLARGLPAVRLPALFVHGADDPLPPRSTTHTAALLPGALVEIIPKCAHFPCLERPYAFRAAVERLLAQSV